MRFGRGDISFPATTVARWVWLLLYLVVDVWSRKVVALGCSRGGSSENRAAELVAAGLPERALPRPRGLLRPPEASSSRDPPRDNGMHARGPLESEGWRAGVLRSFSQAQGFKRQPLLRIPVPKTLKYRPDYPRTAHFASIDEACSGGGVCRLVTNHWHRSQRINSSRPISVTAERASTICKKRAISTRRRRSGPIRDAGAKTTDAGVSQKEVLDQQATRKAKTDPGA